MGRLRGRYVLAVGAVVGALIAGGVAYASIPDSAGVVHGCLLKGVGTLRVIDTSTRDQCTRFETPIQWSQTGPQGPAGKNGTNGMNGAQGPQGVSVTSLHEPAGPNCTYGGSSFNTVSGITYACNGAPGANGTNGGPPAWFEDGSPGDDVVGSNGHENDHVVATVNVPAGTYGVQAHMSLTNDDGDTQGWACRLDGAAFTASGGRAVSGINGGSLFSDEEEQASLEAVATLSADGAIRVLCSGFNLNVTNASLTALQIQ